MITWRRSNRCINAGCVEVGATGGAVLVRDSKLDDSQVLSFTPQEWTAFIEGVKAGEFDHPGVAG